MPFGLCCIKKDDDFSMMESCMVQIEGSQIGLLLNLEFTQIFKNNTEEAAQISYIFPNDMKICIYDSTFVVDTQIIKPKLVDRKEARLIYNEAVESGKTAIYGANLHQGLTEFHLGNLPINSECKVILKIAFKGNIVDLKTFYFKIPLDVYTPSGSVGCLNYKSNFSLKIQGDKENVNLIRSNVLNGLYDERTQIYKITNSIENRINENSIIVQFKTNDELRSSLITSSEGNFCHALIVNNLTQANHDCPGEYVFLIDCSGSMKGNSIKNAGKCLDLFIRSLPNDSFFNLIRFGTSFDELFSKPVKYQMETASKGIELARSIKADLGGTNIYNPLVSIFKDKPKFGRRNIFILTDGEVRDKEQVIELVSRNSAQNRCFTIGLGRECDGGLVEGIAKASGGKSDFVQEGDSISEKVIPQLQSSMTSFMDNVEIYCEGEDNDSLEIVPFPIKPIYQESQVFLHGKKEGNSFQKGVLVTGDIDGKSCDIMIYEVTYPQDVLEDDFGRSHGMNIGKAIGPLFAFEQLKSLETKVYITPAEEELAIQLSLKSGVLSKFTGYVGMVESSADVSRNDKRIISAGHLQKNGCVIIDGKPYSIVALSKAKTGKHGCGKVMVSVRDLASGKIIQHSFASSKEIEVSYYNNEINNSGERSNFDIFPLMNFQNSNGFWENHAEINKLAGIYLNHINNLKFTDEVLEDRCIATLVAIAILHVLAPDQINSWRIIEEKGMDWLRKNINADFNELLLEIEEMIQKQNSTNS